mgnify:FL=1
MLPCGQMMCALRHNGRLRRLHHFRRSRNIIAKHIMLRAAQYIIPPKGGSEMFDFLTRKAKGAVPPALPEGTVRRRYSIEGQVQGVGFRYRARYAAQSLELTGWVQNEDDGSVTLEVQGDPDQFMQLFAMIQKSDYIRITGIREKDLPPDPWERGFSVKGY